ncbi:MAG: DASH family cryptochrome [Verrucomicrobiales bacterium]|nr:DASH family cryptochrome [Verrucomicrobiales bacterium]
MTSESIKRGLYWFRNDLRLEDNPALTAMAGEVDDAVFVFVVDDRWFETTPHGFGRMGPHRMHFMMQSVQALQLALLAKGHDLIVLMGTPAACILGVAETFGCSKIYAQKEHTHEEVTEENRIASAVSAQWTEGQTLIHPQDLPFEVTGLPNVFSNFRKHVEIDGPPVRQIGTVTQWPSPVEVTTLLNGDWKGRCEANTCPPPKPDAMVFLGGADAGWKRLKTYFWDTQSLSRYKKTRNGLIGWDYSSKFSPWLAWGCLSARQIHAEIIRYEQNFGANESTYWLVFELLWRDYFRFVAMQHGDRIWSASGIRGSARNSTRQRPARSSPGNRDAPLPTTKTTAESWQKWTAGNTPEAFVNANMRELQATGFMSNRGRQNVASYAVHDLGLDWRRGAAWFERGLIDFDPCSNTGNWLYVAGLGNDPRPNRKFDLGWQTQRYDPDGAYRSFWNTPSKP